MSEPNSIFASPEAVAVHDDGHGHDHPAGHDDHDSPENVAREVRVYLTVFASLAVLTAVTVWVGFKLQLPMHYAIMVALAIASVKGFLVAGYFMHLLSEKKLIYAVLALTVMFFIFLIVIPFGTMHSRLGY